jgi:hypothetical protein
MYHTNIPSDDWFLAQEFKSLEFKHAMDFSITSLLSVSAKAF